MLGEMRVRLVVGTDYIVVYDIHDDWRLLSKPPHEAPRNIAWTL
jgi:hypothetical protein